MTKVEIINETVTFYSEDVSRRSLNGAYDRCFYNGFGDKHCAFGRCMLPEYHEQGTSMHGNSSTISGLIKHQGKIIDKLLEERYRGHELLFWNDIQTLHDTDHNWDENGLTGRGQIYVDELLVKWNEGGN